MPSIVKGFFRGAAAGAAGTTALNAVTYVDMLVRARPTSSAPQDLVETLADDAGVDIPGSKEERQNRIEGAGPLAGSLTGVAVGALAGVMHAAGLKLPTIIGAPLLGLAAMVGSDLPLALTGVSDPRTWAAKDWVFDAIPHLAYGVVTHAALASMENADLARVGDR